MGVILAYVTLCQFIDECVYLRTRRVPLLASGVLTFIGMWACCCCSSVVKKDGEQHPTNPACVGSPQQKLQDPIHDQYRYASPVGMHPVQSRLFCVFVHVCVSDLLGYGLAHRSISLREQVPTYEAPDVLASMYYKQVSPNLKCLHASSTQCCICMRIQFLQLI